MTLWVCKGGRSGERESRFKENSLIAIGFNLLDDLSKIQSREELKSLYEKAWPDASQGRKNNHVGQIYAFLTKVKIEDLVVVPMKTNGTIWIGRVKTKYKFREDLGSDMKHTRDVKWLKKNVPRNKFDQAILYTFGSAMTFSRAQKHQAERMVMNLVEKGEDQTKGPEEQLIKISEEEEVLIDLAETATNQLRDYIYRRFKGHKLAELVAGILKAQGLKSEVSPPGPDGAVDITASSGFRGLSEPRICIQVKSQESPVGVTVYRELRDKTNKMNATHGLLVSWGGFKKTVYNEAKDDVFKIRLWGSTELIKELLQNYANLPTEIKTLVPLKQIWILTELEGEE